MHDFTTGRLRWLAGGCSCGGSALHDSLSSSYRDDDQWPAHQLHQPEPAFEGLGVQVVAMMMSSNWNVKDVNAKYSSHPAKFRNSIREIKQRADLG